MAQKPRAVDTRPPSKQGKAPPTTKQGRTEVERFLMRLQVGSEALVERIEPQVRNGASDTLVGLYTWHKQVVRVISWARKVNQQRRTIDAKAATDRVKRARRDS